MRVAVTGVSGLIGSHLARALHGAGHEVTGLVRESSRRDHIEQDVDRFVVGVQTSTDWHDAFLDGADAVVHNSVDWSHRADFEREVQSNLVGSLRLLKASAPRQFVFVSSIAVHHDIMEREPDEHGVNIVDEDHPLRPATTYGAYKAAVEAYLWAEHFGSGRHTSAVRPCAVYGMDPNLSRSIGHPIVERLREHGSFDRQGGGKFVHVEDVASAITAIIGNAEASGRAYNLVDCYARWADWATMAASILGIEASIDTSSPDAPKNMFSKASVRSLGVELDRGHEGIRSALRDLIGAMS